MKRKKFKTNTAKWRYRDIENFILKARKEIENHIEDEEGTKEEINIETKAVNLIEKEVEIMDEKDIIKIALPIKQKLENAIGERIYC